MSIISYIILFIFIYLLYFVFVISRKNVLLKFKNGKEIRYLKYKYKIKVNDKNLKLLANIIALANSFIIVITLFIISFIENFIIKIIVLTIVLIVLILFVYNLIGIYYKNKGGKKNV